MVCAQRRRRCSTLAVGVAAMAAVMLLPAAPVVAQARVVVQVRTPEGQPAEGRVTLIPTGEGKRHGCKTEAGKCSMEGVAGGSYKVHLDPAEGDPPPPRKVMIPPAGKATLIVATAD